MLYLPSDQQTYPPEVMQAFREGRGKDVLNKYLYDYRQQTDNEDFHFLIGMCMYHMGYYEEAYVAFQRSQQVAKPKSYRGDVFSALVLLMAQKDEETLKLLAHVPLQYLTAYETLTVMAIKNKLQESVQKELLHFMPIKFQTQADCLVMAVFAAKYAALDAEAYLMARSLEPQMFQDFQTYMYVIEEIYKLQMTDEADYLLENILPEQLAENAAQFAAYIKTCYAVGLYNRMSEHFRLELLAIAARKNKEFPGEWQANISKLYCMEYDRLEKQAPDQREAIVDEMRRIENKSEEVLLYITTYDIEHFDGNRKAELKENLEKLISLNQTSLRYRKLYCDLLIIMGCLRQADEVIKATLAMRKKEEAEEFSLLYTFHSFYMPKSCMLRYMPVHEHDNGAACPICFGSGSQSIVRAIGAGHSPSSIFTDNLEKKVIEPNEAMLRDLVNWQPMNVASPIVAKYLLSLGAYMSAREYPDVLVPGQTYLYLSLKPEAQQRLLAEGYSMLQIDPFSVAMDEKGSKDDVEGRDITEIPVTAADFTLEIIHAISPQDELDNAPDMPMPEQYVVEGETE